MPHLPLIVMQSYVGPFDGDIHFEKSLMSEECDETRLKHSMEWRWLSHPFTELIKCCDIMQAHLDSIVLAPIFQG